MENANIAVIDTSQIRYYSQLDESALFWQLDRISCIVEYDPTSFSVSFEKLDKKNLAELIGCCHRYKIDMRQFQIFDTPKFSSWLRDKEAYWYESIFGASSGDTILN